MADDNHEQAEHEQSAQASTTQRSRTVTWADPMLGANAGRQMSGIAYEQAMLEGRLPPPAIAQLLGFTLAEVGDGRAVFQCQPAEYHYNPLGIVHGGLAATLLDSAIGFAVLSQLPAGTIFTTLELKVNYIRALTSQTGLLSCTGTVIHAGNRVAVAEARLTDAAGRLYAHATSTCLIIPA